jgi:hypothetical protein
MAVTLVASGTRAASVGTEHFESSPNVAGAFVFTVDLSDMAAGDVVELRGYKMAVAGGTQRSMEEWYRRYEGAQPADAAVKVIGPIFNTLTDTNAVRFSLKQTFGSSADIPWSVQNVEDATAVVTANVTQFNGVNATSSGGRPEVNTTHWGGTVVASANVLIDGAITAAKIASDAITSSKVADGFLTAAKFASGAFGAVWSVATRLLTAGTNIVLAKDTGVTGFNDLDAAGVRGAVGLSNADLDSQLNLIANTAVVTQTLVAGMQTASGSIGSTGNDTTHVHLPGLTFGNDEINNQLLVIYDDSESEYHARWVEDWVNSSKLATVAVLPFTPQNGVDGFYLFAVRRDVTAASVADKTGYALTSAYDPAKTAAQAGDAMTLTAAYDAAKTAATQASVDAVAAKTTNLPSDPADQSLIIAATDAIVTAVGTRASQASVDDVPTKEENADALLGRNIAGGSDGGRDVTSALRATRNRVVIDGSTITVYAEDDTTPAWTGTVTRVELDALQEINPA